jgi:hypothetical protein
MEEADQLSLLNEKFASTREELPELLDQLRMDRMDFGLRNDVCRPIQPGIGINEFVPNCSGLQTEVDVWMSAKPVLFKRGSSNRGMDEQPIRSEPARCSSKFTRLTGA